MACSQMCSKRYYQFFKQFYFSCQNKGFTFHHKILLYFIWYHTVLMRVYNPVGLSLYIILHMYPVCKFSLRPVRPCEWYPKTITAICINKLLTRVTVSSSVYSKYSPLIKWWNYIAHVVWNCTFNTYIEHVLW